MRREHPTPTEKSNKEKIKKHPSTLKSEPPKPNGTMQTAGLLLVGGGGFFAFLRYFFGELWAKEIARKLYDWLWSILYDDFTWWNPFHLPRTINFLLSRVHFEQHAPRYFFYLASIVGTAIPTIYVVWRKYIKPRFFCVTDPATDECIDLGKPCVGGNCNDDDEEPDPDADNEEELICQQQTQVIAGRAVQVQVCLTAVDREAIEQAKKQEAAAERAKKAAEQAKLKQELAAAQQLKAGSKRKATPETNTAKKQLKGESADDEAADTTALASEIQEQNPVVLAQTGEEIDLEEACDCQEDPDLTLPKTLLTMAKQTPTGSKFTGSSKQRSVKTSESREASDTKACEHKTDVEVAEDGRQTQNNRRGTLLTRLLHT